MGVQSVSVSPRKSMGKTQSDPLTETRVPAGTKEDPDGEVAGAEAGAHSSMSPLAVWQDILPVIIVQSLKDAPRTVNGNVHALPLTVIRAPDEPALAPPLLPPAAHSSHKPRSVLHLLVPFTS